MRTRPRISTSEIHFIISKMVSADRADATEVPMSKHKTSSTNSLPATRRKVHPNFENKQKIFPKKISLASTTTRKIRWIHWWNPLTVKGDICNFVTAVSALSNTSQRSVYNYARRLILRTGQHLPCAAFSSFKFIASHPQSFYWLQPTQRILKLFSILTLLVWWQGAHLVCQMYCSISLQKFTLGKELGREGGIGQLHKSCNSSKDNVYCTAKVHQMNAELWQAATDLWIKPVGW